MAKGAPVVVDIVERIAQREGIDPVHLDTMLYESIDPDALAALTNGTGGSGPNPALRIEFTFHGYDVTVDGTGAVTIDERQLTGEIDGAASEGYVGD